MATAPDGTQPDAKSLQIYGSAAVAKYDAALAAPDFGVYGNPFIVRLWKAEMLVLLDRLEDVRSLLKDWLPPPALKLLPSASEMTEHPTRLVMYAGYRPEALAHAWALMAETSLRLSARPGISNEQRVQLCRQGVEEAAKSSEAHLHDYEGALVRARLLLQLSSLSAEKDLEAARRYHDEAAAELNTIPESSSRAANARNILEHVPRP
jgi:hypothetical protein